MTVLSERLDVICDFIRDASASFMVIDGEGVCLFANHAIQQLNVTGPLSRYFNGDAGRATLKVGAGQSTPLPFSFEGAKGRQRANIRRITPATEEVILLVKIIQGARMAAFTLASQSEGAAALQAYHKRRVSDRFGAFFNTAREGNAILNRAGGFVYGNTALLRLVGLTEDELARKTLFDVISEDSVAAQIIGTGATRVDLSRIAPSQFDATLHGPQRDIPVSVSLGSNGSESSPEFS